MLSRIACGFRNLENAEGTHSFPVSSDKVAEVTVKIVDQDPKTLSCLDQLKNLKYEIENTQPIEISKRLFDNVFVKATICFEVNHHLDFDM